jgi:hypothetical protein
MSTTRLLGEVERQQTTLEQLELDFTFPLFNSEKALESQRQSGYRTSAAAAGRRFNFRRSGWPAPRCPRSDRKVTRYWRQQHRPDLSRRRTGSPWAGVTGDMFLKRIAGSGRGETRTPNPRIMISLE